MLSLNIVWDFFEQLFENIGGVLNVIWAVICVPIYGLIRIAFNLFIRIAELNLLSNDDMNFIYKRVTMIITIVMTFYVIFSLVKYTISPDTITDKEKGVGQIAYRMMIAILLIALMPTIFSMAYKIQNRVIRSQVIPKVILGEQVWDYSSYGSSFAADTFSAFYRVDRDHCGSHCDEAHEHVSRVIEDIRQGGSTIHILGAIWGQYGSILNQIPSDAVEFDGLLALIFGCYVIYVLFLYSIDVAVRFVQLLYLQVISPIAIMGFIVPSKDNPFTKWLQQAITTYLDLFIRISVMYFAMLLIQVIGHSLDIMNITTGGGDAGPIAYRLASSSSDGQHVGPLLYIFIIMGVLIFVQRAPKLLDELLPKKGGAAGIGMGLSWKTRGEPLKKSIDSIKKPIAATAGAIASGASTLKSIRNGNLKAALNGKYGEGRSARKNLQSAWILGKSAFTGGKNAAKNGSLRGAWNNRGKAGQEAIDTFDGGGTPLDRDLRGGHYANERDRYKRYLDGLNEMVKARKAVKDTGAELKANKTVQTLTADWNERGIGDATAREDFKKDVEKLMNVYARQRRTDAETQHVKDEIGVRLDRIFTLNEAQFRAQLKAEGITNTAEIDARVVAEQEKLNAEKIRVKATLDEKVDKDRYSVELNMQSRQISQAQDIALATKDEEGKLIHIIVPSGEKDASGNLRLDADGNPLTVDFTQEFLNANNEADASVKAAKLAELKKFFAEHLGDIEKFALDKTDEMKYKPEYKAANANASSSSSSSGNNSGQNS